MLSRAVHYLQFLFFAQPAEFLTGLAFLCVLGAVTGISVTAWTGQRHAAPATKPNRLAGTAAYLRPAAILVLFGLGDWALLLALPWLRLSFSTQIAAPLLASLVIRIATLCGLQVAQVWQQWRARRRGPDTAAHAALVLFLGVNLVFSAVQINAYVVEPLWVQTTSLALAFDDLDPAAPPVRIVHLSDTHIERSSYREQKVIERVNALQPDLIVLSGDYLNLSRLDDPVSAEHWRAFISQMHAPYGIYAVRGSVEKTPEAMAELIQGTDVVWLEQETVTLDMRGQQVTLVGVACSNHLDRDEVRLDTALAGAPSEGLTLLLYHSPDLIAQAADRQIDLYLGGHTHGGQLRLPFYGAMVTCSIYGKQYEAGLAQRGATRMYISRGIGFEGGGMPRARFLCRPEIVSIDLTAR